MMAQEKSDIYFKVDKTEVMQSKIAEITMCYDATSDAVFKGFQVEFMLPEGFKMAYKNGVPGVIGAALKEHNPKLNLETNERDDGNERPTNVYLGVQIDLEQFPVGEGIDLFTFYVECGADVEPGDYSFSTSHCELANMDTGQSYHCGTKTHTLSVVPYFARVLADTETTVPAPSAKDADGKTILEDVIIKRTVKKDVWSTLTLPFALPKADLTSIFGEGVKVADFSDFDYNDYDQYVVNFKEVDMTAENFMGLAANHPYLIKSENALTEFKVADVAVNADEAAAVVEFDNGRPKTNSRYELFASMIGTLKGNVIVPENCFLLRDNKFYVSTGSSTINAFRAYFNILEYEYGAGGANITFMIDGEATDIEGININGKEIVTGDVYSVNGTYMGKAENVMNKLPRGIYIINNKKVVVK